MKGFAPCRRPLNSGFDDTTIPCFDGLLTASHLSPIGGSRACLLRFILAPGDGLGPHVGGPWRCQGLGLGPGLARGRMKWAGLHFRPGGSIVLLGSRDPGHGQSVRRFWLFWALLSIKQLPDSRNFYHKLLDLRLRKVTVELFDWTAPSQPGGTLFEGPADLYCITILTLAHFVFFLY